MILNPHLRSHLLAFWLAVVAVVLGLALIVAPATGATSPSLSVMGPAGIVAWGAAFALGGAATLWGLVALRRRWEAAGSVLLSAAYFSAVIGGLISGQGSALGVLFLSAISIGFFHRAWFLATDSNEV
jgi:hypothetical protein